MECILNYCSEDFAAEIMVICLYGVAVFVTVGLTILAQSKSIRTAGTLIALTWVLGVFSFFYLNVEGYFVFAVMLDTIIAHHFWRMAKVELFPAPLCIILLFEITFIVFAKSVGLANYATLFVLNRIFELILLYLIGCSLFRIAIRKLRKDHMERHPGNY